MDLQIVREIKWPHEKSDFRFVSSLFLEEAFISRNPLAEMVINEEDSAYGQSFDSISIARVTKELDVAQIKDLVQSEGWKALKLPDLIVTIAFLPDFKFDREIFAIGSARNKDERHGTQIVSVPYLCLTETLSHVRKNLERIMRGVEESRKKAIEQHIKSSRGLRANFISKHNSKGIHIALRRQ